ncbi:MAG: hypothetical protein ACXAC7_10640 [Candidatus Hodarchaeales archaeon]
MPSIVPTVSITNVESLNNSINYTKNNHVVDYRNLSSEHHKNIVKWLASEYEPTNRG